MTEGKAGYFTKFSLLYETCRLATLTSQSRNPKITCNKINSDTKTNSIISEGG